MSFALKQYRLPLFTTVAVMAVTLAASCGGAGPETEGGETPGGDTPGRTSFDLLMNESAGNVFVLDGTNNPTLAVPASAEITVQLVNNGSAIHNMRFGGIDMKYFTGDDAGSDPEFIGPGGKGVLVFTAPGTPGAYIYQCDIHPTDMFGEIKVVK